MPCFSPLEAFQLDDGRVVFSERGGVRRALSLACGQCIGCRLDRSRQWAVRCMHEAQMHERNSFVTLTYSNDFVPTNGSLEYGDFQLFMRRVRKRCGRVRFYMCGEYGEVTKRPHFHACLFGVDFDDREFLRVLPSGCRIYRSALLEDLWPFGFCSVGDVTFDSAAYVARYICKKVTGSAAADHYRRVDVISGEVFSLVPEFCHMSLKPGIGAGWFSKFTADAFPLDYVIMNGQKCKVPKYYKTLLKAIDPFMCDDLDFSRELYSRNVAGDVTPARLFAREIVARAGLEFKKRSLEY